MTTKKKKGRQPMTSHGTKIAQSLCTNKHTNIALPLRSVCIAKRITSRRYAYLFLSLIHGSSRFDVFGTPQPVHCVLTAMFSNRGPLIY